MNSLTSQIKHDPAGWPEPATNRSPLHVFVVWHPTCAEAYALASGLLRRFMRDPHEPSERGIGLPVFFHPLSLAPDDPDRAEIDDLEFDSCEREVVVVLIDDHFVLDDRWRRFMGRLVGADNDPQRRRIFPIALSQAALRSPDGSNQMIRLIGCTPEDAAEKLLFEITHELCRFLMDVPRRADRKGQPSASPVQVFASHAKRDGLGITEAINEFIRKDTQLDVFLDLNSIAPGEDFVDELAGAVETSALLIIQTDAYGSRYWCQRELLWAKQHGRPIVIVSAITAGERRIFPYIGNVPSVRWQDDRPQCRRVVSLLLHEVLRVQVFRSMRWTDVEDGVVVLSRPPELINLVEHVDAGAAAHDRALLYPDPPIADIELDLLGRMAPQLRFITPTTRHHRRRERLPLRGVEVALSISECDDSSRRGLAREHIEDAFVELARHLLALGATLAYGGDLRTHGYTELLADLVRNHNSVGAEPWQRIRNYLAWPDGGPTSLSTLAQWKPDIECVRVERPAPYEHHTDDATGWLRAATLSEMRMRMTMNCRARIVLGGQVCSYQGFFPGILEEAWRTVEAQIPTYLVGGFGGVTHLLVRARSLRSLDLLTPALAIEAAHERRSAASSHGLDVPDADRVCGDLVLGVWPDNGLSRADDQRLWRSRDVPEIVTLIVRGLLDALITH